MIIRIMGEGQFLLDEAHLEKVNAIDNEIVEHVSKNDAIGYKRDLKRLISTVREFSKPLDPSEIAASDIIIPPPDMSFEEARRVFSGEGLISG